MFRGRVVDLSAAMRAAIVAGQNSGLEAGGGGAAGRTVGPGGAGRAAKVLGAVGVVVALGAGARRPG